MRTDESRSFGELLKRHRLAAGLSQEELAERAGLSPRGVSDLERGARPNPRPAPVRLLADALGLTEDKRAIFLAAARSNALAAPQGTQSEEAAPAPTSSDSCASAPSGMPSGTVTFLFTDIEGSTRLLQALGTRYADVLGGQQRIVRAAFAAHGGHEVDTQGDSFFVVFATAQDAVACAIQAQRALRDGRWPRDVQVRVRMGLHSGAPQLVGSRYVGLDVHRAARIAAAGHGGQVLVSEATAGLVRHDLPDDTSLRDLGAHRLKDLQQPERVYQLVLADLPSEFPALKALDARSHNLPVQPSPILGRERETETLCALLLRDDVRLVTLTGPGGVGKTRLSLQVAAEVLDAFPDGVRNVRLSRLTDPDLVVPTIATTLELKESGATPLAEVLQGYLQDKRLLLVLDNFEQVVGAAPGVGELLDSAPGLKLLVTSRVRLHLRGEREYAVTSLALPDPVHLPPLERLSQYAAVALFVERAQAAQADFQVSNANAPAVAAICARLDGLPLAIELAAARVKLLPPPALLARLERALPVLTGGARNVDERQQTMRNTLAWSLDLLAPEEQRLFCRLAVFVGGWTFEAAQAVCVAPEGAEPLQIDVLDGLSALVDQSLVQQREEGGEPRFGMLYVIREYALEQLEASGEAEGLRQAHVTYFVTLAERAEPDMGGPEAEAWLDRWEREQDNLRAALGWAQQQAEVEVGLRLAAAVFWFWFTRTHLREGRAWLEDLLRLASEAPSGPPSETGAVHAAHAADAEARAKGATHVVPDGVRARALTVYGGLAVWQGDYAVEPQLEQAVALGRAAGDLRTAAVALQGLSFIASDRGDKERAVALLEESLRLIREAGNPSGIAVVLTNLGAEAYFRGDLDQAEVYYIEALTLVRERGSRGGIALNLGNLGDVARKRGELAKAEALWREALTIDWQRRDRRRCAENLEGLAKAFAAAEHGERAARLLGAAKAVRETLGAPILPQDSADIEQAVASMRTAMGEAAWNAAYQAGRSLSLEEAIAEALGEEMPSARDADG